MSGAGAHATPVVSRRLPTVGPVGARGRLALTVGIGLGLGLHQAPDSTRRLWAGQAPTAGLALAPQCCTPPRTRHHRTDSSSILKSGVLRRMPQFPEN